MVANFSLNGSDENHDFEPLTRKIFREAVSELAVKAKETLPDAVNGRVDKAVAIVLTGDVELMADGKAVVGSQSDAGLHYVYDGECECRDSDRAEIDGWCKHRIAVAIAKRANALAKQRLEEHFERQQSQTQSQTQLLPEAPASANVYVTIQGRKVQLTLRDSDEDDLLSRMELLLSRFPEETPESATPPEGWCPIHQVRMKRSKDGKGYYHKAGEKPDGKAIWCRGR